MPNSVVVPEENPLDGDEVDGVFASMIWISIPRRLPHLSPFCILGRFQNVRGLKIGEDQIYYVGAEAALERSKRNEALAKKELASFRSKMCKDEAEAKRMFGDAI
ncbi:hypothetical protein DAPPUDRAFT_334248 [Daphnia pulex]|uniref:Uncharacterized protein n=1 Tax=Daphnia pulex TaxID=6669 RepID=E9HV41_DAPPU|nr:hypothetical protein DAPPUDRAFT_334248 [Daphnia pulex]|eukprot:EFX64379.1 hypothetical protein DAPPUDRAFT_334248 [Daphnia pulex]